MKKRLISLLLTLIMIMSMMPLTAVNAWATSESTCPICGMDLEYCSGWWNTTGSTHQRYCGNELDTGAEQPHAFDGNDKCTVCGYQLSALYQGNKYSLKDAVDAAEDGSTIELIHEVSDGEFDAPAKSLTLDYNGYGGAKMKVKQGTSLTLTNSAATTVQQAVRIQFNGGGKVTIANGVQSVGINNSSNVGTVEITGGTFSNYYSIWGATISGGVFNSCPNAIRSSTISGGSFQCAVCASAISGGIFVQDPTAMTGVDANTIAVGSELVAIAEGTADYTAGYRYKVYKPHTHDSLTFEPISSESEFNTLLSNGGNGYLTQNLTLSSGRTLSVGSSKTVNLCLSGHVLDMNCGCFRNEGINVNAALNIFDDTKQGKIIHGGNDNNGAFIIYDGFLSSCTMRDITIENCASTATMNGSGTINILGGSCTLSGVTIQNCTSVKGGAIYKDTGTLNLTNCTIENNTATSNGGGLYIKDTNNVSLSNKVLIKNNTSGSSAKIADNVYLCSDFTTNPFKDLTSGSSVGITRTGGSGKIVNMSTSGISFLFSDSSSYEVSEGGMDIVLAEKPVCFVDTDNNGTFAPWETKYGTIQKAVNACTTGAGTIVMIADSQESVTIDSGKTITLDLNGYVLQATPGSRAIVNNGNLTIIDSNRDNRSHNFEVDELNNATVWKLTNHSTGTSLASLSGIPADGTIITVPGGCITGNVVAYQSDSGGHGGIQNNSVLTIKNGNLVGNYSNPEGGAVRSTESGNIFTMTGGRIIGNGAGNFGAGVYCSNSIFTMSGDAIIAYNDVGVNGGGIHLTMSTMTSLGGNIFGNRAEKKGGALVITPNSFCSLTNTSIQNNLSDEIGGGVYIGNSGCFAKGTRITMADGSYRNIEDVRMGDMVKTIDHITGQVSASKVISYYEGEGEEIAFTLHFSDGTALSIVGAHDLLEQESMQYVELSRSNAQGYIGKQFYNADSSAWVTLQSVTEQTKPCKYYALYTAKHINCIANGMLSVTDDAISQVNLFEMNSNLQFDPVKMQEDIETYGLMTLEECPDITAQEFEDWNAKYIKIAIGKGLITMEEALGYREEGRLYENAQSSKQPQLLNKVVSFFCTTAMAGQLQQDTANLEIGKNVIITGNTSNGRNENVYLTDNKYISLASDLTGSAVGVTLSVGTGKFTVNGTLNDMVHFSSDHTAYVVKFSGNHLELGYDYENRSDSAASGTNIPNSNNGSSSTTRIQVTGITGVKATGLAEMAINEKANHTDDNLKLVLNIASADNTVTGAQAIETKAAGKTVNFYDIDLMEYINNAATGTSIENTNGQIIETVIPYDLTGKTSVAVYRYHGTEAVAFIENQTKADGTFYIEGTNASAQIHLFTTLFSTYGIGYQQNSASSGYSAGGYGVSGLSSGHTITSDLKTITKVMVDGKLLDSQHYTVSGGNVILTQAYCNTLTNGQHTVKLYQNTKVATAVITIQNSNVVKSPTTGDMGIVLYCSLTIGSIMGTGIVVGVRKRKEF